MSVRTVLQRLESRIAKTPTSRCLLQVGVDPTALHGGYRFDILFVHAFPSEEYCGALLSFVLIPKSRSIRYTHSLVHVTFVLHGVGNNWSQHRDMHMSLEKPIDYSALEWQLLWRVQWC